MSRNRKIIEFLELVYDVHRGEHDYPNDKEINAIVDVLTNEILKQSVDIEIVRRWVAAFFRRRCRMIEIISTNPKDGEKYIGRIMTGSESRIKCLGVVRVDDVRGALVTFASGRWAVVRGDSIDNINMREAAYAFSAKAREDHDNFMNVFFNAVLGAKRILGSFFVGDPPHPQCFTCHATDENDCAHCTAHEVPNETP
jgi:hypothetical protein